MAAKSARVVKYQRVKETLAADIERGKYSLGERLPSEKQLAEQFEVSIITIRQAVEALQREGYVEKIQGSGTYVRHLRPSVERKIWALTVPVFGNYWWPPLAQGLAEIAAAAGIQTMVSATGIGSDDTDSIRRLVSLGVNGLAVSPSLYGPVDPTPFVELSLAGIPFVFAGEYVAEIVAPRVVFDDAAGARLAVEHLVSLGHRRIAFLSNPASLWSERLSRGFNQSLQRAGLEPWPLRPVYAESWSATDLYRAARDLLAVWPRPTAVICASDHAAQYVCHAAEDAGVSIPGELSVVGYGNVYVDQGDRHNLTTVALDRHELGQEAGKLLLRMMMGGAVSPEITVLPSLKSGGTTAAPLEEAGGTPA